VSKLSPITQAVLDAANGAQSYGPDDCLNESRWITVAALRAAVEQVLPHEPLKGCDPAAWERDEMRVQLLAIASELEAL
jgi:hypothetical protein